MSITNTGFRDNYAIGTDAKGGAIYTKSDMSIFANDGKTTEFSGNYTLNGSTRKDEAIYVENSNNTLTLSATDGGHILFKDSINGASGYNVVLTGDETGTISLYNGITNANVRANGTNIDLSDGNYFNYDFLSLASDNTANFSLDVDFAGGKADKFTLGSESRGTIYINDLNFIGSLPTVSKTIQLLTGPDTISIGLSQDLIDKYHKVTINDRGESDEITQTAKWGATFGAHLYKDTIEEGIRTAVTGAGRENADSLEYYVNKTTEDLGVVPGGDTMMLMNQSDKFANRTFNANNSSDTYTVGANLGKTYGTFNVNGYSSSSKNTLDANNHTLFEVGDGAKVELKYLTINNLLDQDGSLLTIDEGGSANLTDVNIDHDNKTAAIVNDGTLTLSFVNINGNDGSASIVNDGNLTLSGGSRSSHNVITGGGIKGSGTTTIIWSSCWDIGASGLQDTINNGGLYLNSGTLTSQISGSGTTFINNNSTVTTSADNLRTHVRGASNNPRTTEQVLNLTGGEINSNIYSVTMNILGDVTVGDNGKIGFYSSDFYTDINIAEGGSLTTDASKFDNYYLSYTKFTNDGVLNLTGGEFSSRNGNIYGDGTVNILGDVTLFGASNYYVYNDIHVKDGTLTISAGSIKNNVVNDSILKLTSGTIAQGVVPELNGTGKTQIAAGVVYAYYTDFNQDVEILSGNTLYTNWNRNFTNIKNDGQLSVKNSDTTSDITSSSNHGKWTKYVSGDGTLRFTGGYNSFLYIDNEVKIDNKLIIDFYTHIWSDADLLGGDVKIIGGTSASKANSLTITGGTINHQILGNSYGYLYIDEGLDIISNALIQSTSSNFLQLQKNSSLTISADNLDANTYLNSGSNLKLKSGTWDNRVNGSGTGTVTILSGNEVQHHTRNGTGQTISSAVVVEDGAKFTASASNLTGSVTNDGELYLSGVLNRKYGGTGTTYIDDTLHVTSGAGFPATFDLNEGTLISNSIATYTFGHTTNNGGLTFNINAAGSNSDLFNLSSTSDAVFDIKDIVFGTYKSPTFANSVKTYQILKGSPSYLTLGETMHKDIEIYDSWRDILGTNIDTETPYDVYFDDPYKTHHTSGTVDAEIELATTDSNHDSVKVTYGDYHSNDYETRLDLLSDWNQLNTSEVRNFNFKTADDVYTSIQDVGSTTYKAGDGAILNINGVSETTTDSDGNTVIKRSVIDLASHNGFRMGSTSDKNVMNIYNVEFRNGNGNVIQTYGDTFGTLLEDGTIKGGIVNSAFINNTSTSSGAVLYIGSGTIVHQILNSTFEGNSSSTSSASGGAIYNYGGTISNITDSTFVGNTASSTTSYGRGSAIYNYNKGIISNITGSTFAGNTTSSYSYSSEAGGTIYNYSGSTINNIAGSIFEGNTADSRGGAIYNYNSTINNITGSIFEGNTASYYGGAIYNYGGTISNIAGSMFEGNTAKSSGGAIYNTGTVNISDTTFKNNSTLYSELYGQGGGAIFNQGSIYITNSIFENNSALFFGSAILNDTQNANKRAYISLSNCKFINNTTSNSSGIGVIFNSSGQYASSDAYITLSDCSFENNSAYQAVIYNVEDSSGKTTATVNIVNSSFKNNTITNPKGAVTNYGDMTISALGSVDDEGNIKEGLTEFTGNDYAIYNSKNLTLNAATYGNILINDKIRGENRDNAILNLTGDSTGTIKLFNTVSGGIINADKTNITTANGEMQSYTFKNFNSDESAKWTIDINFATPNSDRFDVGAGTGTMYLDNLNVLGTTDAYTKIRVLNKTEADTTVLELNGAVVDIRDTLGDTVYNDETYHQEAGYAIASSWIWNFGLTNSAKKERYGIKDQISQCIDEDLDALNLIVSSDKNQVRNFVFRDGGTYKVTQDLDRMYTGTLNIQGVEGSTSTIDADGHKLFYYTSSNSRPTLNLSDVKLTGVDELIGYYININVSGKETILDGEVSSATKLNSGNLRFNSNTFASASAPLTIAEGTLALNNGKTETYDIYSLTPGERGKLALDIDLNAKVSDQISVKNSTGVITVSSIDFINGIPENGEFVVQVIKNSGSSTLQLALDESIKHYVFKEYQDVLADDIQIDTDFGHSYYNRLYTGTAHGDLSLATTNKTNDSIKIKVEASWNDNPEIVDSMGDTLYLVNSSDLSTRNFNSSNSSDVYNLSVDLDKTAAGNLNLNGTLGEDGNLSTINFKNHKALQLGDDTNLAVNNVRLTGARDLISVDSSNTDVVLNNAFINGNILGSQKYDLRIDGTDTTTILGKVTNSDVVFANGGLVIAEKTFADDSVSLIVEEDAYVHLNDGDISNYEFSNITSSNSSKYGLDLDLETRQADMITAEGSGRIVFEKFDIVNRNLSNVDIGEDYTIRILNTSNDSLQLAISETVQMQLAKEYKLGTVHEIIQMDEVQAVANWKDQWKVVEGDYDVYGKLKLATTVTTNDSLHLYELRKELGEMTTNLGDTLMLVSILETDSSRRFWFDSEADRYELSTDIDVVSSGVMTIDGVSDGGVRSVIDMNSHKGFKLSNATEMTVNDVEFVNAGYKDGSLFNLTNENSVLNLNGITITETTSTNAIKNNAVVNFGGLSRNWLYSGITGDGITNITNGILILEEGLSITQSEINVNNGALNVSDDSQIIGALTVATKGHVSVVNANAFTSSVVNDGDIIIKFGTLTQDISGNGFVDLFGGSVINKAMIDQEVGVEQNAELTTSADNIGGVIHNLGVLNLTGTLKNVVTHSGVTNVDKTLTLAAGAGIEGTLNLNDGAVSTTDGKTTDYEIGTMLNYGSFDIDLDLSNKVSDKFIVGNDSEGTVYLDEIAFSGTLGENESFKVQVLETHGTDAIQLALNEELTKGPFAVGTVTRGDNDLRASVNFDEKFHDNLATGTIYAELKLATTATTNDSIELSYTETIWGDSVRTERVDTLKELAQYDTDEDKNFNFKTSTDKYTVAEDLGEASDGVLNINGVSSGDKKSEIDLNDHSGFELTNDTTLNISDVTIGGGKDDKLIVATNPDAEITIENVTLNGDIDGSDTSITITGEDIDTTVINGTITDSDTTLEGGRLQFNTDTFGDADDTLTVSGGRVDVKDGQVDTYDINKLTSSEEGKYSIDVDLGNNTSDKFDLTDTTSSGVVYIDEINYINGELPEEFKAQILDTNGNENIQIKLSDEIKNKVYVFGRKVKEWGDLKADVDFDELFHDYHQEGQIKGSIKEATTQTTNDSISLKMDAPIWGELETTNRLDTLHELSVYETEEDKTFNFKTSGDEFQSKTDVGVVDGSLTINGVSDGEDRSNINLTDHRGFELETDSSLNLRDVSIENGKGDNLIIANGSDSVVTVENTVLGGNIVGDNTQIRISGDDSDTTVINGTITDGDTTLSGGTLQFNTDTFADKDDTLTVVGGRVDVQDSKVDTYDITKLTSNENGKYSIDVDLSNETSDKFNLEDTTSSGTVYIDEINYINGELPTEFTTQVLETNGNDKIQIKLSDEIKNKIYDFGKTEKNWNDLKADVDFDEYFHDFHQEGELKGSIKEATTHTTNDSISLKMDAPIWGEIESAERLDTLHEISDYVVDSDKTFNFKSGSDKYESKANVGELHGTLSINGVKAGDHLSTVDLTEHKGFELVKDSKLNVNNTLLTNGAENTLITAEDETAEVTLANSQVEGVITGVEGYKVNITGSKSHKFALRNPIENANVRIDTVQIDVYNAESFNSSNVLMTSGLLNLTADRRIADIASKTFEIGGTFDVLADADLRHEVMDKLPSNTTIVDGAHLNVAGINLLSDTSAASVAIPFAYKGFKDQVKYTGSSELSKETQITTAYAPIYKYDIRYDNRDDMGYFVFSRHGANGGNGGNGGNSSDSYNPAILASPVATQAAGQSAMNEAFRYVFEHADAFTQLPSMDRLTAIHANETALSTDFNHNLGSLCTEHNNKAGWYRPYSTFETIDLKNGPKVSTINYGSLVGYDSDFRKLKNGWTNVGTGYLGYNGSQIHYSGVDTTMNGGLLGITETFYKGNFWTALTATAGAGVAETRTMYGKEDSTMLMAGIGSKTGYNFEFKEGKYIVQPIMFMSYTFVNTFDYTNAAGVRINNDPMHTVQINPSMRFIANLPHGWQPYASVGMVWNLMNESSSRANGIKLPEMHTKPYVEYGLGLQKNMKDHFTAFGQAMIRNGGRNGIALTAGFRWAIGHDHHDTTNDSVNASPSGSNRKVLKELSPSQKQALGQRSHTTLTSNGAVIKKLN